MIPSVPWPSRPTSAGFARKRARSALRPLRPCCSPARGLRGANSSCVSLPWRSRRSPQHWEPCFTYCRSGSRDTWRRRFTPPGHTAVSFYRLLVGGPTFLVWYVLALVVMLWQFPRVLAVSLWLTLPWLGIFAVHYWGFARQAWHELWDQFRALLTPKRVRELHATRHQLQLQLKQLEQDYRNQVATAQPKA